jgi:hypothetical protein
MIFRIWHGWATPENAAAYEALLSDEVERHINGEDVPGLRSVQLLRRPAGDEIEFVTILSFTDVDAVRRFAGEDYEAAVVHPLARAVLSRFDRRVQHYEGRLDSEADVRTGADGVRPSGGPGATRGRKHLTLLTLGLSAWVLFWLAGLPAYYQQYAATSTAIGCVLLSVAISLGALAVLSRGRPETRLPRAIWISFYFTVPLAILDWLYCGVHLGHGLAYLGRYWYVTVFYLTPWLTFVPTALLLNRVERDRSRARA